MTSLVILPSVGPLVSTMGLGESLVAWAAAIVAVVFALGVLIFKRPVYSAMCMIGVMLALAVIYTAQEAPFLGVVQVVVYTGAVMMLILFVLMLVGITKPEPKQQGFWATRLIGIFGGLVLVAGLLIVLATSIATFSNYFTYQSLQGHTGFGDEVTVENPANLAITLLSGHTFTLELVGTLLIIAAIGAMTLTHNELDTFKRSQRKEAQAAMKAYQEQGKSLGMSPQPGVYAESNQATNPALGPDGRVVTSTVPEPLRLRGQDRQLAESSPSTAVRVWQERQSGTVTNPNKPVFQSGLAGMPGEGAPVPADPFAAEADEQAAVETEQEN